jgi:hypothetical protein
MDKELLRLKFIRIASSLGSFTVDGLADRCMQAVEEVEHRPIERELAELRERVERLEQQAMDQYPLVNPGQFSTRPVDYNPCNGCLPLRQIEEIQRQGIVYVGDTPCDHCPHGPKNISKTSTTQGPVQRS